MMCGAIADGDEKSNKDLLKERRYRVKDGKRWI
jgi:hypothetical protein